MHQQQPPTGYGPPYGPYGYGPGGAHGSPQPPKKGMSTGMILLIVVGCLFGGCVMCGAIGAASNKNKAEAEASVNGTAATATDSKSKTSPASKPTPMPTSESTGAAAAAATGAQAAPEIDPLAALPATERKFCETVVAHAQQYKASPRDNQLKRSKVRGDRKQALSAMSPNVSGWKGKIVGLSTNGEGKAVLVMQLPCDDDIDVTVKTWNNAMSDIMDHTLIPQSSKMYDTLADLGKGKAITFGGTFLAGDEKNGWRESSLSEEGSMTDPEFIFRFAQVSADP